jgi:hypothetical protein
MSSNALLKIAQKVRVTFCVFIGLVFPGNPLNPLQERGKKLLHPVHFAAVLIFAFSLTDQMMETTARIPAAICSVEPSETEIPFAAKNPAIPCNAALMMTGMMSLFICSTVF